MKKGILFGLTFLGMTLLAQAQVTFNGNGNGGFGGVLGNGSVQFSDNGTSITVTFNRGTDNLNDVLVIYIDSKSGGFTNTSTFNDQEDIHRRAISSPSSQVNFPLGFEADYAIAINRQFAAVWELASGGNNSLPFQETILGFDEFRSASLSSYGGTFNKSSIGISGDVQFRLFATYLNGGNGFLSNEGIGLGFPAGNVGFDGSLTVTSYFEYPSGAEVTNTKTVSINNSTGFRLLSSPTSVSIGTLLGPTWTQGAVNSDHAAGQPNLWSWNNSATNDSEENWSAITSDIDAFNLTGATGFLYYHFNKNNFANEENNSEPTVLTVSGAEKAAPVSGNVNTNANRFALNGNPFATSISVAALNLTDNNLQANVQVWNPADAGSWAQPATIAPFQAFFVQTAASGIPALEFTNAVKTTGGTFLGKQAEPVRLKIIASQGDMKDHIVVELNEKATLGYDQYDLWKLNSMSQNYVALGMEMGERAWVINSLPFELDAAVEIPVSLTSTKAGEVTLSVEDFNVPSGWSVRLVDMELGSSTTLQANSEIVTNVTRLAKVRTPEQILNDGIAAASSSEPRFKLIITPPTVTSNETGIGVPSKLALHQNYPNPFNPSTNISFDLPAAGEVILTVHDMLGRTVAVLVQGGMNAGAHTISWDASRLASGMYLYRLQANGFSQTKKMTLVK